MTGGQAVATTIPTSATLGEIVAARPETATVLERLRLDYCCGGRKSLGDACAKRGLDAETVATLLASLDGDGPPAAHDVSGTSIGELCRHIVDEHHEPLPPRLARISELLGKVVRAHGTDDPSVVRLQQRFEEARTELVEHMRTEERELFPACRKLDARGGDRYFDRGLLAHLEDDHGSTGAALADIRSLAGEYRPERAHCNTHRVLLHELAELERELHLHIHEENNVLFPKVRAALAAA